MNNGKEIQRWADPAMFTAQPIDAEAGPQVRLLTMTPDPLGAIAAACKGYKGEFVDSLSEITDDERLHYFEQVQKTHLKAPFEFVQFHFSIKGVTRAFTHQMVRQRTATYVQESLRFAVKDQDGDLPVGLPLSLAGTKRRRPEFRGQVRDSDAQKQRDVWDGAQDRIKSAYMTMVDSGMPAEDARGLLPTNILTRIQYRTDLRALIEHGGNRLCTQAQFEWRTVFAKIVEAIRHYDPVSDEIAQWHSDYRGGVYERMFRSHHDTNKWQYEKLADVFRPICYLTGKCEFNSEFDRPCSIRDRVQLFAQHGIPSSEWDTDGAEPLRIRPVEWLADPKAAR